MHDLKYIRENPEAFDAALKRRGAAAVSASLLALDEKRRAVQTEMQAGQARRNEASKAIGAAMGKGDTATAEALKAEVASLKDSMPQMEEQERALASELDGLLAALPNLPADDTPDGADENDNIEVSRWGAVPKFDFEPKDHADLGPPLGLDFETGVAISGTRFTFMRGQMARLNRAIGQFMLDHHTQVNGYSECNTPVLVNDAAMYGTDKLPKFADDSFRTTDGRWLIPTAEVSLTSSVAGGILDENALPIRLTAHTLCFRSEAGAAGKDTKGLIRQHQFEKVELVSVVRPQDSEAEHERMTAAAESILQALALPYRKILLCTGDMGFGARKTYDLEVWLPGQGLYREISSCSNCGDFQARRMNTRYRPAEGKGNLFVHTLNGSGLAVGRTLVAVLENYQQADGSVLIPSALLPYMGGISRLEPMA
ncbi:serine--tRNA ligase [Sphingorhabdus sp. IMCC26285]|uniref:Serine--tRNA ligase n=1 Tax=Sphingorhabdus profundilacus TaxID=2509718 RepID=A0A6I4LST2_9SPHN|nr:serine--tRNA ligase [Sphingorhabdus profundilacus]MVZ96487.1 serine--tRNA ligase [Sphingorhabdus profundilacus]